MSSVDAALAFIERLSPDDYINIANIAEKFEYNYSALLK